MKYVWRYVKKICGTVGVVLQYGLSEHAPLAPVPLPQAVVYAFDSALLSFNKNSMKT